MAADILTNAYNIRPMRTTNKHLKYLQNGNKVNDLWNIVFLKPTWEHGCKQNVNSKMHSTLKRMTFRQTRTACTTSRLYDRSPCSANIRPMATSYNIRPMATVAANIRPMTTVATTSACYVHTTNLVENSTALKSHAAIHKQPKLLPKKCSLSNHHAMAAPTRGCVVRLVRKNNAERRVLSISSRCYELPSHFDHVNVVLCPCLCSIYDSVVLWVVTLVHSVAFSLSFSHWQHLRSSRISLSAKQNQRCTMRVSLSCDIHKASFRSCRGIIKPLALATDLDSTSPSFAGLQKPERKVYPGLFIHSGQQSGEQPCEEMGLEVLCCEH